MVNLKGRWLHVSSRKHSMLFFSKMLARGKDEKTQRGLAQYTGKIFRHHFWKLKFCCSTLSTACLAATPILGFLSATRDPHLISPLLSRLPNIPRRFYSTSHTYAHLASGVNIFISSKQDSPFSPGEFRKARSHLGTRENRITKRRM